jgi:glycosyltransferase involved in cell wall biosynthesis
VLSDIPVFHEVGGDAVRYVPPLDSVAWARVLTEVSLDKDERARLSAAGHARAQSMTWKACATATAKVYEDALSTGAPSAFT